MMFSDSVVVGILCGIDKEVWLLDDTVNVAGFLSAKGFGLVK